MSFFSVKHVFGVLTSLKNSLFYLNDHCYLYPSSRHLILSNSDDQCQRVIPYGNQSERLECLTVSPNKEYLAIALKSSDKCRILIEYLNEKVDHSNRRGKVLWLKDSTDILSLVFSSNSNILLSLHGSPDYVLICWTMDRMRSLCSISLRSDLGENSANVQISFNPNDNSKLLITANHLFRQYTLNKNRFSVCGEGESHRCQTLNITCHCWTNENDIFLALQTGWICRVNQSGEILEEYHITTTSQSMDDFPHSQVSSTLISKNKLSSTSNSILCLLPFSRGLFVSTTEGSVLMYERSVTSGELSYLRRLILPSSNVKEHSMKRKVSSLNIYEKDLSNEFIRSLALSPNEETLLVGTNLNHLYQISFSQMDTMTKEEYLFRLVKRSAHQGTILMGRECIPKSLLFTIGIDRFVKVWNLQTKSEELSEELLTDPLSFDVHPTGQFICICFVKMVEMYLYTIEGLILFKQFPIPNIRCIEYSHGGHLLSMASENILQFHSHQNYDQMRYSQIPQTKFRLIRWSRDDTFLISIHFDQKIIRWNPYTGERLSEVFTYQINDFTIEDVLMSVDEKFSYLLCNDQKIKKCEWLSTIVDIDIPFEDCIPRSFSVNEKIGYLFVGSTKGSVYGMHLNGSDEMCQVNVHQGCLSQLLISSKNQLIISMGEDGNIILYNFKENQGNEESSIVFRDEIVVKEVVLKEQNIQLNLLRKEEYQLMKECESILGKKEEEYRTDFNDIDFHCQREIHSMQTKFKDLKEEKDHFIDEQEQEFNRLMGNKERRIEKWNEQKKKLYEEMIFRDRMIEMEMKELKNIEEEKRELTNNSYRRNIQIIQLSYREKLTNIQKIFFQKRQVVNGDVQYLEEMKDLFLEQSQLELREVEEFCLKKQSFLLNEIEALENEEIHLKRRVEEVEEEGNSFDIQMKDLSIRRNDLIDSIRRIDQTFHLTKQTIEERHLIIEEKFKRTNEMETRRDELEKLTYVFNYKIRELTNEVIPRESEVESLIDQLNNMNKEYQRLIERNEKYSIEICDYQGRFQSSEKDLLNQMSHIRRLNEISVGIKEDWKISCRFVDQPTKLIELIRQMYVKYILQKNSSGKMIDSKQKNFSDSDRQRSYFEGTNQRLQRKSSLHLKRDQIEHIRRIEEQISLMREISSYSMKVVEVQRRLMDLDILSNLPTKGKESSSKELLHILKVRQGSTFIQDKEKEFQILFTKQEKRLEQLRNLQLKLEEHLHQSQIQFTDYQRTLSH